MATCARCGEDVDDLQSVSPGVITKELLDSVDHGREDLAGDGEMNVCAECLEELTGG